jgi:hypothetical protein
MKRTAVSRLTRDTSVDLVLPRWGRFQPWPGLNVPVRIDPAGLPTAEHAHPTEMAASGGPFRGRIEIEVCGARIRVEAGVDMATLSTVLSAVRGGR